jgi:uncharacterized membrane protein YfcA
MAGGGTFFTFGAFVAVGLPPVVANASSAVALTPANLGSVAGYVPEIRLHWRRYRWYALVSMVGGLVGAALLLMTPGAAFRAIVPWCLAFATVLFAAAPTIRRSVERLSAGRPGPMRRNLGVVLQSMVAIYGGYFGAGMGIIMLSAMALAEGDDYHFNNGAKNLNALLIQIVATAAFALEGIVSWPHVVIATLTASIGGYFGVGIARRVPLPIIRATVVLVGALLTLRFWLQ